MNSWQLAQQIRHELQLVSWEQGSADPVFGSRGVLVYAGALSEEQHPPGFPFALVTVGSGSPDPDDPIIEITSPLAASRLIPRSTSRFCGYRWRSTSSQPPQGLSSGPSRKGRSPAILPIRLPTSAMRVAERA